MSDRRLNDRSRSVGPDAGRRRVTRLLGAAAIGAVGSTLAACSSALRQGTIKLGYVSPRTGALAPFAETDAFVIEQMRRVLKPGVKIGGTTRAVEILVKDSQSNPNRAAAVTAELILEDGVDIVLVSSTPETTNPVSDQCELNRVPCISTVAPWQPWFFGRGGSADKGFRYTFHFFWGLDDIIGVFTDMWTAAPTNRIVAALWPNDADGSAWGDAERGFPRALRARGFQLCDPGRYANLTNDFAAQLRAFREAGAEILTGVPLPPDFTTFWTQAAQQGFRPRIASVGKAVLFPVSVEALGKRGEGLSSEVWWTPTHPFTSSLTGQSAAELAAEYERVSGRQWTQPLGFAHALFEVAVFALQHAADPTRADSLAETVRQARLSTVVGPLDFAAGPIRNVATTPLVGGQWQRGSRHPYELVVVSNRAAATIPLGGSLSVLG